MRSKVSVTQQIDDVELAARELLLGVMDGFQTAKNSVGILSCYSDMEAEDLLRELSSRADFELIGCTAIANMDERTGFHDMAATLTLLTSDDVRFVTASSGPITKENVSEQIRRTYSAAADRLGETPALVVALPPYRLEIMLDAYANEFNAVAPGVPVVGGLPSNNATGDANMTFHNDTASTDRMVLLAMAGDIHPVFSVQNVVSNDASRKRRVTRARDNVVYEVGNQRFTDYLKEIGLPVDKLAQGNATITFVSNPLLLEKNTETGERAYSFARTLHEINLEEGSGTAIGEIPDGATLSVCTLRRDEIEQAAVQGIRDLKQKMEAVATSGYVFSTVLAVSCIGRHLLLLPHNDIEVRRILSEFPSGLTLSGFYSYGEIGPQGSGQQRNFAHNESLVLCAF